MDEERWRPQEWVLYWANENEFRAELYEIAFMYGKAIVPNHLYNNVIQETDYLIYQLIR